MATDKIYAIQQPIEGLNSAPFGFGQAGTTPGSASGGGGNRGYTTASGSNGIVIIRYPISIAV
jgi:hypothetical protein